jgi:hypothetical protein
VQQTSVLCASHSLFTRRDGAPRKQPARARAREAHASCPADLPSANLTALSAGRSAGVRGASTRAEYGKQEGG